MQILVKLAPETYRRAPLKRTIDQYLAEKYHGNFDVEKMEREALNNKRLEDHVTNYCHLGNTTSDLLFSLALTRFHSPPLIPLYFSPSPTLTVE